MNCLNRSCLCELIEAYPDTWRERVEALKVRVKPDKDNPNIYIFNYLPQADFSDPIVRECRGIIVDVESKRILCRPFDKFGNWFEEYAAEIDFSTAKAQEKIDGSLVKLWWHNGEWHWSTMSTIDARDAQVPNTGISFFDLIQDAISRTDFDVDKFIGAGATHMFELVSPYTQVVVRYDEPKLYYLGSRGNSSGAECIYKVLGRYFDMPKSYDITGISRVIEDAKALNGREHEGFVVVDAKFNRVKVKSPEYVRLHHCINNGNLNKAEAIRIIRERDFEAIEAIKTRKELEEALGFYCSVFLKANIWVTGLVTIARMLYKNYESRKEFATTFASKFEGVNRAIAFMAIDSDIDPECFFDTLDDNMILKLIPEYSPVRNSTDR